MRITWGGGYLSQLDEPFHDFAGSGVVHLIGGAAALAGTVVVGPRTGRWDPNLAHKWVILLAATLGVVASEEAPSGRCSHITGDFR